MQIKNTMQIQKYDANTKIQCKYKNTRQKGEFKLARNDGKRCLDFGGQIGCKRD